MDTLVRTYTFDELDYWAKARAVDDFAIAFKQEPDWWDSVFNGRVEEFQAAGVRLTPVSEGGRRIRDNYDEWYGSFGWFDIGFDVYGGSGDYARFTADVELATFMRHRKIAGKYRRIYNAATGDSPRLNVSADVTQGDRLYRGYSTQSVARVEVWGDDVTEEDEAQALVVQGNLQEWVDDMTHNMLLDLYHEWDYFHSEEFWRERFADNETRFDVHGNVAA